MIFVYSAWDKFCSDLQQNNRISIPAREVYGSLGRYTVLKHDIENNVAKAYKLAEIEHKYGHRGTYYAHAYLLEDEKNIELLKKMQDMGHEISYHYDVMDSNKGNIEAAIEEFSKNVALFESLGFIIETVCQHGNPVVERVGYTSNRDFFRSSKVQKIYLKVADIMVDYKKKYNTDYIYYSDAGREFKMIYDPIDNDIINSDDKNISYKDLNELFANLSERAIISTHPHRWASSTAEYLVKEKVFKAVRGGVKVMIKIPVFKKIFSKYYYLAKKF